MLKGNHYTGVIDSTVSGDQSQKLVGDMVAILGVTFFEGTPFLGLQRETHQFGGVS